MNNLNNLLFKMAREYNEFAQLVALNRIQKEESGCDEVTLHWNRGCHHTYGECLKELASAVGATLTWDCRDHEFHAGDYHTTLTYKTVHVQFLAAQ